MKKHLNKTKIRHTKTIQKVKKILQKAHQEKTFKNKYYNPTTKHPKTITLETNLSLIQQIQILTNHIMSRLQIQIINMTTNGMQNNITHNTISTMSNKSSQIS